MKQLTLDELIARLNELKGSGVSGDMPVSISRQGHDDSGSVKQVYNDSFEVIISAI